MLSEKETTHISKLLSLVLRHQPEKIGLQLDRNGWADVAVLLKQLGMHGLHVTPEMLEHVVATNNKKRFAFNDNHTQIRASQGHSVEADLGYTPVQPPDRLYHGTAQQNVPAILKQGLEKRSRQHVHLSTDADIAIKVGRRHGQPQVLTVEAGQMYADGFQFYLSANGVWLTDYVPGRYIQLR